MSQTEPAGFFQKITISLLNIIDRPLLWALVNDAINRDKYPSLKAFTAVRSALAYDARGMKPHHAFFRISINATALTQHDLAEKDSGLKEDFARLLEKHNDPLFWRNAYHNTGGGTHRPLKAFYAARWALSCDAQVMEPYDGMFLDSLGKAISHQHDLAEKDAGLQNDLTALLEKHNDPDMWSKAYEKTDGDTHPSLKAFYAAKWALSCDAQDMDPDVEFFEQALEHAFSLQHALADKDVGLKDSLTALLKKHNDPDLWSTAHDYTNCENTPLSLQAFYAAKWVLACDARDMPSDQSFMQWSMQHAFLQQHALAEKDAGLKDELAQLLDDRDDPVLWMIAYNNTYDTHASLKAFYAARWALACGSRGVKPRKEIFKNGVLCACEQLPHLLECKGDEGAQLRDVASRLIRLIKTCDDVELCQDARNGAAEIPDDQPRKQALFNMFAANLFFVSESKGHSLPATLTTASSVHELTAQPVLPLTRQEIWKRMRAARPAPGQ